MVVVSIGNLRTSLIYSKENNETQIGEKHNSINSNKR